MTLVSMQRHVIDIVHIQKWKYQSPPPFLNFLILMLYNIKNDSGSIDFEPSAWVSSPIQISLSILRSPRVNIG
jgi:hypothetical protein